MILYIIQLHYIYMYIYIDIYTLDDMLLIIFTDLASLHGLRQIENLHHLVKMLRPGARARDFSWGSISLKSFFFGP